MLGSLLSDISGLWAVACPCLRVHRGVVVCSPRDRDMKLTLL